MSKQPLTKAERKELRRLHDYASGRFTMRINGENDCRVELANGPSDDERGLHARFRYATGAHAFVAIHNHLPRLLADLDAAEAERDEIKTALGVMGATRERALEVAGSQDALEERIDSMSRERDVALKGWSAAEAARDAAAAQRDRAESERDKCCDDYQKEAARAVSAESERDALKAKLAALVAINKKVLLQATIRKVPPFESFFEVGWGSYEEKEWSKALRDASS